MRPEIMRLRLQIRAEVKGRGFVDGAQAELGQVLLRGHGEGMHVRMPSACITQSVFLIKSTNVDHS